VIHAESNVQLNLLNWYLMICNVNWNYLLLSDLEIQYG
jgi:hypothetical protein